MSNIITHLTHSQIVRVAIGVTFLAVVGYIYVPHVFYTYSVSAVVSAPLITVSSPIDGMVKKAPPETIGTEYNEGDVIAVIENPIFDNRVLETLKADQKANEARKKALLEENEILKKIKEGLSESIKNYRESIEKKLVFDIERAKSHKIELEETVAENKRELIRKESLLKKKTTTQALYDGTFYKTQRAKQEATQAELEINKLKEELEGVRNKDVFTSQLGRVEVPYQVQRFHEIEMLLAKNLTTLAEIQGRIDTNARAIVYEQNRFEKMTHAELKAPNLVVLWRNLVTQGSYVNATTPVAEVLDCKNVYVDMTLHQSYFEKLRVGDRVGVKLTGSNEVIDGAIVAIRGGALSAEALRYSNFAGKAKIRRNFEIQVLVAIDEKVIHKRKGDFCNVGQNGEVILYNDRREEKSEVKPEVKPDENPEVKIEEMPEANTGDKPEVKLEDTQDEKKEKESNNETNNEEDS